jgi:hypothetical protein
MLPFESLCKKDQGAFEDLFAQVDLVVCMKYECPWETNRYVISLTSVIARQKDRSTLLMVTQSLMR